MDVTFAIIIFGFIIAAALVNAYKIYHKQVDATLSTWAIILVASVMSFATYLSAENRDVVAGALNGADVFSTSIITLSIVLFGARRWRLRSFEKFYFAGLVIVGLFWFVSEDPFVSNLLIQVIIALGYFPTIHTMFTEKKNTESFVVWGLIWCAAVVSLYPSVLAFLQTENILSLVYTLRSILLLTIVLALMYFYRYQKSS